MTRCTMHQNGLKNFNSKDYIKCIMFSYAVLYLHIFVFLKKL